MNDVKMEEDGVDEEMSPEEEYHSGKPGKHHPRPSQEAAAASNAEMRTRRKRMMTTMLQ